MKELTEKQGLRVGEISTKKRKWYSLIDKIWSYPNLEQAFYDVKKNRGAHGVDTITIQEYELELEHNFCLSACARCNYNNSPGSINIHRKLCQS